MTLASRFSTSEPACCTVCRRHAQGLAYLPNHKAKPLWLCDDTDCHYLAKEIARMPLDTLDRVEREAALAAGDAAGSYLDSLHQTDLAALTAAQWEEFLRTFLISFEKEMRQRVEIAMWPPG